MTQFIAILMTSVCIVISSPLTSHDKCTKLHAFSPRRKGTYLQIVNVDMPVWYVSISWCKCCHGIKKNKNFVIVFECDEKVKISLQIAIVLFFFSFSSSYLHLLYTISRYLKIFCTEKEGKKRVSRADILADANKTWIFLA